MKFPLWSWTTTLAPMWGGFFNVATSTLIIYHPSGGGIHFGIEYSDSHLCDVGYLNKCSKAFVHKLSPVLQLNWDELIFHHYKPHLLPPKYFKQWCKRTIASSSVANDGSCIWCQNTFLFHNKVPIFVCILAH